LYSFVMALRCVSTLLEDFGDAVWRADALAGAASASGVALPSGHAALDAQLPGGGWPVGALCEILQVQNGLHEWRLLLPILQTLGSVREGRQRVVLVGAPYAPFGPGLSAQGLDARALLWVKADTPPERLWAAEQALRCAGVAALLVWLPKVRADHLRRLHMAAHTHARLLWVMRPATVQDEPSPAVLRLLVGKQVADQRVAGEAGAISPYDDALQVQILKRRGPPLVQTLTLPARHARLSVLVALNAGLSVSRFGAVGGAQPTADPLEHAYAVDCLAAAV
jgi:protein ImuA